MSNDERMPNPNEAMTRVSNSVIHRFGFRHWPYSRWLQSPISLSVTVVGD